ADDPSAHDRVGIVPRSGSRAEGTGQPLEQGGEELLLELEVGGLVVEGRDVDRADVRWEAAAGKPVVASGGEQQREQQRTLRERAASRSPEETAAHLPHCPASGPAPRTRPSRDTWLHGAGRSRPRAGARPCDVRRPRAATRRRGAGLPPGGSASVPL